MIYLLVQADFFEEVQEAVRFLEDQSTEGIKDIKLVLVCDGAEEKSINLLNEIKNERLLTVLFQARVGMGACLSAGLNLVVEDSSSNDDQVVTCHAPLLKDEVLRRLLLGGLDEGMDVVVASRYLQDGGYGHFPLLRRFYSQKVNALFLKKFPIKGVRDYTVFLRGYRLSLLKRAVEMFGPFGLIQSRGYVANTEILIKLSFLTEKIKEVYYPFDFRRLMARSRISVLKTMDEYMVLISYLKRIQSKIKLWKERDLKT